MDSRESPAPPHHLHHHHHHHHSQQPPPQQQQQQHQGIMMHNPYAPNNNNTTTNTSPMISPPNSSIQNPRFPFNSITSQHQYAGGGDGSSSGLGTGGGFTIEAARKKRGRPRKYSPDANNNSNIALGLSTTSPTVGHISTSSVAPHGDSGGGAGGAAHSSEPSSSKKGRGRPAGSGKKQLDALGAPGVGFTPHVIIANAGEDIASKILAFSQEGPRSVCILSANGAVSNVTLSQPAMSAGCVKYEGRFEIISLTGSFSPSESGNRNRSLTISLAGSDGHVLGGGVAGMLIAATPVQVIVGSFIADGKKSKSGAVSSPPATNMLNFGGGPVTGNSPPSEGEPSGESSEESDSSAFNRGPEHYNNANQPTIQSMPMYTNMGWPNSTMNMLPN